MKNKILIVAAHPDDEILGCGGTIARMASEGATVATLILGEGITSRDMKRDVSKRTSEINTLKKNISEANQLIGVRKIISHDFPDNRFDTVPLLDIIKVIENAKNELQPDIIFTHFSSDLNIDHYITNKAVLAATRPMEGETVKEVYSFEVLSSTEWNYPLTFSPDFYVNITDYLLIKKNAMSVYQSELKEYPHPRSLKAIELNAAYWGTRTGLNKAEAFQTVRRLI